jgi:hypothetical protein
MKQILLVFTLVHRFINFLLNTKILGEKDMDLETDLQAIKSFLKFIPQRMRHEKVEEQPAENKKQGEKKQEGEQLSRNELKERLRQKILELRQKNAQPKEKGDSQILNKKIKKKEKKKPKNQKASKPQKEKPEKNDENKPNDKKNQKRTKKKDQKNFEHKQKKANKGNTQE